jgi:hypothetical protein
VGTFLEELGNETGLKSRKTRKDDKKWRRVRMRLRNWGVAHG